MDQPSFQKCLIDCLHRLEGEFRGRLRLADLVVLMGVAVKGNPTEADLLPLCRLAPHTLRDSLRRLSVAEKFWQSRLGLIAPTYDPAQSLTRYSVTVKGALIVRNTYMLARLDDKPANHEPLASAGVRWRF